VDKLAKIFPKDELFVLTAQMKRAADSVVLNIAEGSTLQSKSEFKRFLVIANRSALEVVACFYLARERS
jgi:four helix bundle protein